MCGSDQSLYPWSLMIACSISVQDILLQSIAPSLLVDTCESIGAAVGAIWSTARAFDFCCGIRKDLGLVAAQADRTSSLRLRQVLQALVLHKQRQCVHTEGWSYGKRNSHTIFSAMRGLLRWRWWPTVKLGNGHLALDESHLEVGVAVVGLKGCSAEQYELTVDWPLGRSTVLSTLKLEGLAQEHQFSVEPRGSRAQSLCKGPPTNPGNNAMHAIQSYRVRSFVVG